MICLSSELADKKYVAADLKSLSLYAATQHTLNSADITIRMAFTILYFPTPTPIMIKHNIKKLTPLEKRCQYDFEN